jgi:hypothetical protein
MKNGRFGDAQIMAFLSRLKVVRPSLSFAESMG